MVVKVREFGKNVVQKVKAFSMQAQSHVSRNWAAYITGGAGLAVEARGRSLRNRYK